MWVRIFESVQLCAETIHCLIETKELGSVGLCLLE